MLFSELLAPDLVDVRRRGHQRRPPGLDRRLGHDLERLVRLADAERVDPGAPVVGEGEARDAGVVVTRYEMSSCRGSLIGAARELVLRLVHRRVVVEPGAVPDVETHRSAPPLRTDDRGSSGGRSCTLRKYWPAIASAASRTPSWIRSRWAWSPASSSSATSQELELGPNAPDDPLGTGQCLTGSQAGEVALGLAQAVEDAPREGAREQAGTRRPRAGSIAAP